MQLAVALPLVVALTVAVGALVQAQTAEQVRADVQEELTALSVTEADDIDTRLSSVKVQTRLTADHPAVRSGDADEIRSHLRGLVGEGTIVASSNEAIASLASGDEAPPFAVDAPTFDDDVHVSVPFEVSGADVPVVWILGPLDVSLLRSGTEVMVVTYLDLISKVGFVATAVSGADALDQLRIGAPPANDSYCGAGRRLTNSRDFPGRNREA